MTTSYAKQVGADMKYIVRAALLVQNTGNVKFKKQLKRREQKCIKIRKANRKVAKVCRG